MARHPSFMGPKVQIQPANLDSYEKTGLYVAEEKHDGHWAEAKTDTTGRICSVTSRSGTRFTGANVAGVIGLQTNIPDSTFIGELESGTEAATKRNTDVNNRTLFLFDVVVLLGQSTVQLTYEQRRELLERAFEGRMRCVKNIQLVKRVSTNFVTFFNEVTSKGGEGIILKKIGKTYRSGSSSDGKSADWIRCKRFRYVDYVVMSIGKSEGGSPNFQVGLFINGKLTRVASIKNIPRGLNYESLVGKVIECKGVEVHSSGALRHGHYERTRNDKDQIECTLEAALEA